MGLRCFIGVLAILGSTAAATAKDWRRDQPSRKATGCEWAGPGFAKIEGSETCVRVGGSVRAEYGASSGHGSAFSTSPGQ